MKKLKQSEKQSWVKKLIYFVTGIVLGLLLLIGVARLTWHSKYYPGVRVGGIDLAGLSREEARIRLTEKVADYSLRFSYNGTKWQLPKQAMIVETENTLNEAYRYGRRLQIGDYLLLLVGRKTEYPLSLKADSGQMIQAWIEGVAPGVEIPATDPMLSIVNKEVAVANGTDGYEIDGAKLMVEINNRVAMLDTSEVEIPIKTNSRQLNEEEITNLKLRAERLIGGEIIVEFEDEKIRLQTVQLLPFLNTSPGDKVVDEGKIREYVQALAEGFNRSPQDAKFVFENNQVSEFAPGKDGIQVGVEETTTLIEGAVGRLVKGEVKSEKVEVRASTTSPKVTTDKVNDLGIRERIGRGESYYAHSIPNRVFNVGLAASRTQSALIPPGEEYSFNREVGEISGATGYKTAYVISGGRTVLGDGGGVCQVSTTFFRAAMNAGLPITERWAHAYRVGYYEQNSKPGIDATVYSPSKDFKFKNDTPGYILIQTINDPKKLHLVVEIYGTSDGRVATLSEPKVWGVAPPPPDIYQDDPSLPLGTVRQVDWSAWGAKTSFEYRVTRNGETIEEKTFTSSYRPWQNVYLRGMGQ